MAEWETPPRVHDPAVGLRQNGERRTHDRRERKRNAPDRRRGDRRKRQLHGLLLAAAALASTHGLKHRTVQGAGGLPASGSVYSKLRGIEPSVSVSIDEFRPMKPEERFEALIQEAATKYNLKPELIRAVVRAESAFNPNAVSRVGAQGLMQIMPALAKDMGVTDPLDPRQNIMAGARYLRQLLDSHRGNIALTLASYNAGPGNVRRYKGIPPFKETRNYVKKITGFLAEEADTQD